MGFRAWGSGVLGVWDLGVWVVGSVGFRVWGLGVCVATLQISRVW